MRLGHGGGVLGLWVVCGRVRAWLVCGLVLGCLVWGGVGVASGAVRHGFLLGPSAGFAAGVPAGSGVLVSGGLSGVNALTADSGVVWVAEKVEGSGVTRVDRFDGVSGGFAGVQLNEAGSLGGLDQGVGVGHVTGEEEVYVGGVSEGAGVVGVFGGSGVLQSVWGGAGVPGGGFGGVSGVAVDGFGNVLEDWAAGDVYVAESFGGGVDVFKPVAGGGEPAKPVARLTGTCAAPGSCPGEEIPFSNPTGIVVSAADGEVLVVDAEERVDVFRPGVVVGEYEFVRTLTGPPPTGGFERVGAVAVDGGNGEIYVADGNRTVDQFSAEGVFQGRLTGTPSGVFHEVRGLAVDASSHDVYVGDYDQERNTGVVDVFGGDVGVPDVETGVAVGVGASGVTLEGEVNPVGQGEATCGFVWGTTRAFGKLVACSGPVVEGSTPVGVHAALTGLQADTTYFYRLQASNLNGLNAGEEWQDHEFVTAGPGVHGESVSSVTASSASLEATIDPHGARTSYYFQYGISTAYGSESPAAPGTSIGSGEGDVIVPVRHVQGLVPGAVYHYRVVAVSETAPGVTESFFGEDMTFTTQAAGAEFQLADGRQWELVSPADKHGAQLLTIGEGHITQAAVSGGALTYLATAPTETGAAGFANSVQVLSARSGGGVWRSRDIASAHDSATGIGVPEYLLFSPNLESGVLQPSGAFTPSLSSGASEQTAYLHSNLLSPEVFCEEGCFRPLVTGCPPPGQECNPSIRALANVPAGTEFGEEGQCFGERIKERCGPLAIDASRDLKHVILRPNNSSIIPLTANALPGREALYEWSEGRLTLVNVRPNGEQAVHAALGNHSVALRNAVSRDGSRVVWAEEGPNALYVRDTLKGETLRLDAVQGGTGEGVVRPVFQDASADGSRVFFTDDQELTVGAGKEGNLYECVIVEEAGKMRCQLSDLTPAASSGEPSKVRDELLGASEDGSTVYFVADGALTPNAAPGDCPSSAKIEPASVLCKLYVSHDGETKLIASLSAADYPDWNGDGEPRFLARMTSRVSPDGRWLAFMSQRPLTGYDTRDRLTGQPDEEVYLYDSSTSKIICASCNPTGARPSGVEYAKTLEGLDGVSYKIWNPGQGLAGNIPVWTSYGGFGEADYQSNYLSDNGRLVFNSSDGLVPQDGNSLGDVYQYEPTRVGDCTPATTTGADVYAPQASGCIGLISSGNSSEEAAFLDASATGGKDPEGHEGAGDIFFLTTTRLTKEDTDNSLDIYTAHECTPTAPCATPQPTTPPTCETEESCKGPNTPQPPIFGEPPTSTFNGTGNPTPPPTPHPKPLTQAQKLAKALKACHKLKHHKNRVRCEHKAHKQYPHKTTHKTTKR